MRKFTEVLEEYLDLREQLNSDYYDNRYIGCRSAAHESLEELKIELDEFFKGIEQ